MTSRSSHLSDSKPPKRGEADLRRVGRIARRLWNQGGRSLGHPKKKSEKEREPFALASLGGSDEADAGAPTLGGCTALDPEIEASRDAIVCLVALQVRFGTGATGRADKRGT